MKKSILIAAIGGLSFMVSCSGETSTNESEISQDSVIAKDVDAAEFKTLIESGEGTLLDVRTPGECEGGMIDGAINIDYMSGTFETQVAALDKEEPVYVYCASGGRSAKAMNDLTHLGFKKVYNLLGGYNGWK